MDIDSEQASPGVAKGMAKGDASVPSNQTCESPERKVSES